MKISGEVRGAASWEGGVFTVMDDNTIQHHVYRNNTYTTVYNKTIPDRCDEWDNYYASLSNYTTLL